MKYTIHLIFVLLLSLCAPAAWAQATLFPVEGTVTDENGKKYIDMGAGIAVNTFGLCDKEWIKAVKKHDYDSFYQSEMKVRKILKYPPYYYLANIKVASKDYNEASRESVKVKKYLESHLDESSIILGPSTASNFKRNNIYRFSITIKYRFDKNLMKTLKELDEIYGTSKNVFLEVDINPLWI